MENERKINEQKKEPLCSLKAPIELAKRRSGLQTEQLYRNEFMRDRDRVLYSKSFRRLAGKTQVFLSGIDDHQRTRLTHTLEVSQIARSIAAPLALDVDLVEAIALGHDLGHTPFGHVGERTLHEIMTPHEGHELGDKCPLNISCEASKELFSKMGFKHNLQSLKNVMQLEKGYDNNGLDLTNFTLYGIQAHSRSTYNDKVGILNPDKLGYYNDFLTNGCKLDNGQYAWSLESFVVEKADEIAQRHHDVEDAIRGKLITKEEIVKIIKDNFKEFLWMEDIQELDDYKKMDEETFIAKISRIIVNMFVTQLISASLTNINTFIEGKEEKITNDSFAEIIKKYSPDNVVNGFTLRHLISYGNQENENFEICADSFKRTIEDRVLSSYDIQKADAKGKYIVRKLFEAYYETPQQLPNHCVFEFLSMYYSDKYSQENIKKMVEEMGVGKLRKDFSDIVKNMDKESPEKKIALMRIICDYIAGMTDTYASKTYEELYG